MAFPETIYISFLYILPEDPTNVLSKGRVDKRHERKIFRLNQAPPKWDESQHILKNDRNKEQLCSLLAGCFVSDEIITGKQFMSQKVVYV